MDGMGRLKFKNLDPPSVLLINFDKQALIGTALKKLKFGHFFTLSFGLLILVNFLKVTNADTNDKDRYAIPSTMVNIPVCQKKALLLHPGTIKGLRTLHQKGTFLFQIRVTQKNGVDVLVFCEGKTGNIIREKAN